MPDGVIDVIHKPTGKRLSVPLDEVTAYPDQYDPVSGTAEVQTTSGGQVFALPTAELVAGRTGLTGIDPAKQAERVREQRTEALYGDVETGLGQLGRGALSGLSGGISEQVATSGAGEAELEEEVAQRSANQGLFTAGEIGGELLATVATGGTNVAASGARRAVGGLAALTPTGALSRATARYVADGGGKIGRYVIGGAAEGVQSAASSVLADMALIDEPIATDALASRLVIGALAGGAAGGLAGAAGKYSQSLAKRLAGEADAVSREGLERAGKEIDALSKAGAPGSKPLKYESFLRAGKRTRQAAGEELGQVLLTVDDAAARGTAAASDLRRLSGEGGLLRQLPEAEAGALRGELGAAVAQHREAVNAARRWSGKISKGMDLDAVKAGKAAIPEDKAAEAVEVLARLDEATSALDQTMARTQRRMAEFVPPDPLAPAMLPVQREAAPSRWQAWGEKLADAGAVMEALQTAGVGGIPDVDQIPLIGPALGTYLKFRAASQALGRKTALFKATPKAQAAVRAVAMRDAVEAVAERVAVAVPNVAPVASRLAGRGASEIVAQSARSAQQAVEDARNPEQIRGQAVSQMVGVPAPMREAVAERAVAIAQYMSERAPKPPFVGSAWTPGDWQPSLSQALEWSEVTAARYEPAEVLRALAEGAARPVAADAVREMFPDLWQAQRDELLKRIDRIAGVMPRQRRLNMGQSFAIPLDPSQMPGYRPAGSPVSPELEPGAGFNSGPLPTGSPSADLAETMDQKRISR